MLARKNRVAKSEFPPPQKRGTRFSSTLFSAVVYTNLTQAKCAVVVSKKIAKSAVVRNRIRRQFYAAVAPYIKNQKNKAMIIFYPQKNAVGASSKVLREEIKGTLSRVAGFSITP